MRTSPAENAEEKRHAPSGTRPGTVPCIASWSQERMRRLPVVRRAGPDGEGIGCPGEPAYDRDGRGVLWVRQSFAPGRGGPQYQMVHALRQRRAVRRMLCQVCGGPTPDGGPHLFVLRDVGRPVTEGS